MYSSVSNGLDTKEYKIPSIASTFAIFSVPIYTISIARKSVCIFGIPPEGFSASVPAALLRSED